MTFYLILFLSITYLCCSFQFVEFFIKNKKHSKLCENTISKIVKFAKKIKFNPSVEDICFIFDCFKCCVFVILSAYVFHNKNIMDITAIIAYLGHRFPIYYKFKNDSKNFISLIFVGFILDPITGVSMIIAFIFASRICEYTSVATISAMIAGIVKTLIHFSFFENNDYLENLFFLFFAILAISKNKRALIYVISKTSFQEKRKNNKIEKLQIINDDNNIRKSIKRLKYSEKVNKNNEIKYKMNKEKNKEFKKKIMEKNAKNKDNKKKEYKNNNKSKKQK